MIIPVGRRLAIAAVSTAASAICFHGALASALVTRGDDALRCSDPVRAFAYYERARRIAPDSTVAADRLAFHLLQRGESPDVLRAISVATRALQSVPDDAPLLLDRALAEQRLHAWKSAERDFALAAHVSHDARYEQFAGRAALHSGDRSRAIAHFRMAHEIDPTFAPAAHALKELQA